MFGQCQAMRFAYSLPAPFTDKAIILAEPLLFVDTTLRELGFDGGLLTTR